MRDAWDTILYVGKARNLRKRLGSYRVANPDRMPRRHLRLLRTVVRIELQVCADEASALDREAELLRTLRPRFNRAGTWDAPPRFLAWCRDAETILLKITELPELGWRVIGPPGGGAVALRCVLVRLLWSALHPQLGIACMPVGWVHGKLETKTAMHCGAKIETAFLVLENLSSENPEVFAEWARSHMATDLHPFERRTVEADLEFVSETFNRSDQSQTKSRRRPAHDSHGSVG